MGAIEMTGMNELKGIFSFNRNRNLRTSRAPLKSQAHQGTSLFTSAATNQGVFQRVVVHGIKLRSDFQRVREGDNRLQMSEYLQLRLLFW